MPEIVGNKYQSPAYYDIMANKMKEEKSISILDDYTRTPSRNPRFWLGLILFVSLIGLFLIFKFCIADVSFTEAELKASLRIIDIDSRWIIKEKVHSAEFKGLILVPKISFRLQNSGKKELKNVFFIGVFRFVETGKIIGEDGGAKISLPVLPGQVSERIEIIAPFGYRASSLESIKNSTSDWKNALVEIYVKARSTQMTFFQSYYISKRIDGSDIDIRITQ